MVRIDTSYAIREITLFGCRYRESRSILHFGNSIEIVGFDVDQSFSIGSSDGPFFYVFYRIEIRYSLIVYKIAEF